MRQGKKLPTNPTGGIWIKSTAGSTIAYLCSSRLFVYRLPTPRQTDTMPVIKPLSGSTDAPATHKQPSRKGKKAWRKNVNVSEVQKGLEELNEEIIKGYVRPLAMSR